jgi:nitrate/TMAO reductase-like tetraheme cytochrome c subunit
MKWLAAKIRQIFNWLLRLPIAVKLGLGAVLLILIFGGSYASYRIYDYTQNDPEFCRSCHTMEKAWTRWQESEHSNIGCHSCHHVSPVAGAQLIINYLLERPDQNTSHAKVEDSACETCHYSGDPTWVQVAQTAGHKVHADEQNIACQTCHGLRLHEFRPATEICVACHADHVQGESMAIKVEGMKDMHCIECHPFLREDSPLRPTRETCLDCHQKTQTQDGVTFPDNAPMEWDCRECHKPHQKDMPVVDCLSCHTNARQAGLHSGATHSQTACKECHKPHEWKVQTRDQCLVCHTDKVNHNEGQLCARCHDFSGVVGTDGGGPPDTQTPEE